jgi:uncharacterized protein YggE
MARWFPPPCLKLPRRARQPWTPLRTSPQIRFAIQYQTNDAATGQTVLNNTLSGAFAALESVGVSRDAIRASAIDVMPIYATSSGKDVVAALAGYRAKGNY